MGEGAVREEDGRVGLEMRRKDISFSRGADMRCRGRLTTISSASVYLFTASEYAPDLKKACEEGEMGRRGSAF